MNLKKFLFVSVELILFTMLTIFIYNNILGLRIKLVDEGNLSYVRTHSTTVAEILEENQITLNDKDYLNHKLDKIITKDLEIVIQRNVKTRIFFADNKNEPSAIFSIAENVEQLLREQKITLGKEDKLNVDLNTPLLEDMNISITRITREIVVEDVEAVVATNYIYDATLPVDKTETRSVGKSNKLQYQYEVIYENGLERERHLVETTVIQKGEPAVIARGTEISNTVNMVLSAYIWNCDGCRTYGNDDNQYSRTASGYHINDKNYLYTHEEYGELRIIATDNDLIPMYSILDIEGFGKAISLDRGSAIKGNRIDVLFATKQEAIAFGKKTRKVTVVEFAQ